MRIGTSKFGENFPLLAVSESHIHGDEYRKHYKRWNRGPLQQEPHHNQYESDVLRVTHMRIWSRGCEFMLLLCFVEDAPGCRQQDESAKYQNVAQDMEEIKMRISLQPKQRVPQMTGIVSVQIQSGIAAAQPTRELSRKRKSFPNLKSVTRS